MIIELASALKERERLTCDSGDYTAPLPWGGGFRQEASHRLFDAGEVVVKSLMRQSLHRKAKGSVCETVSI